MRKLLFFLAMIVGLTSFAQTSYTLSTYTSSYTELTNDTPVAEVEGEEEGDYWDDPLYLVPLEFGFQVGDSTYNSLIQLGSGAFVMIANLNYADTSVTSDHIHLFGIIDDLADAAAIEGLTPSEITHNTTGDIGNRITKIQYKEAAFYDEIYGDEPAAENRMNFQMWFYENSGILEIHFGESNIPDPELAFYENPGPGIAIATGSDLEGGDIDWGGIVVGDPSNPTLYAFYSETEDIDDMSLTAVPENGRVYRFTPSAIVGLANAAAPEFSIYPTLVQSEIWVKNAKVSNSTYRILDISGKLVKTGNLKGDGPLDVSNLNPGLYVFSMDGLANAMKFVKE